MACSRWSTVWLGPRTRLASRSPFSQREGGVHVLGGSAEATPRISGTVRAEVEGRSGNGSSHDISSRASPTMFWHGDPRSFTFTRSTYLRMSRWRPICAAQESRTA